MQVSFISAFVQNHFTLIIQLFFFCFQMPCRVHMHSRICIAYVLYNNIENFYFYIIFAPLCFTIAFAHGKSTQTAHHTYLKKKRFKLNLSTGNFFFLAHLWYITLLNSWTTTHYVCMVVKCKKYLSTQMKKNCESNDI